MNVFCNIGQDHSLTFHQFDSFKQSGLINLGERFGASWTSCIAVELISRK